MNPEDFRYLDYRIVSLSAENFAGPEKEREKGKTRTSLGASVALPQDDPVEHVFAEVVVKIDGFLEEGRQDADRSFTATMTCVHRFKARSSGIVDPERKSDFVKALVAQAYPVQLEKIRQLIHGMGFKGVNPDLGLPLDKLPGVSPEVARPSAEVRPERSRRKRSPG